ncbi:hypothetical protein J31TS4_45150 [Paenibacillus sp. J31TS4]|uniref:class I SAM-dependent methyltransferase n=1 Tax=Paenibacillus sp. J31TS4 TaxID=2807195 RepID=UPI001B0B732C|nr:class I SAM-dependent methyltransferase [Paenibacillus sp. J31TS4]GIP41235.1 hypothetical protein J31TS4_45150 [Paenibacillus sp. J31TS4]
MKLTGEHRYLLQSVKDWFGQPKQVAHYEAELEQGPTEAERALLDRLPAGAAVLDVGCGAGRISLALARRGCTVTGVDVSGLLLAAASAKAEGVRGVQFRQVEGAELPHGEAVYDAALLFKVYGYLPTRELRADYLRRLCTLVKPGGVCLLTQHVVPEDAMGDARDETFTENPASRFRILEEGDTFPGGTGYIRWFTERELLQELSASDYVLERFASDEPHGGAGLLRLAVLAKSAGDGYGLSSGLSP